MKNIKITSVAQTEKAGLFTLIFEGDSFSEFQKFIETYKDDTHYSRELQVILAVIEHMMQGAGFLERYFRPEGRMRDHVSALPIERGRLRLYCLRLSDEILIVGGGGVKNVRRYQDSAELSGYVITLQKLEEAIRAALKKGQITIEGTSIEGIDTHNFTIS